MVRLVPLHILLLLDMAPGVGREPEADTVEEVDRAGEADNLSFLSMLEITHKKEQTSSAASAWRSARKRRRRIASSSTSSPAGWRRWPAASAATTTTEIDYLYHIIEVLTWIAMICVQNQRNIAKIYNKKIMRLRAHHPPPPPPQPPPPNKKAEVVPTRPTRASNLILPMHNSHTGKGPGKLVGTTFQGLSYVLHLTLCRHKRRCLKGECGLHII